MSNDDTANELAKLRAELAALKETQREQAARPPAQEIPGEDAYTGASSGNGEPSTPSESANAKPADADAGEEEFKSQLDELAALLEHEIRDLPTITCLAVFSLGILMGRLLR